jgi:signal transduction histidine kinase
MSEPQKEKVLFVDDEPINCQNFIINFAAGYDIVCAANGKEALELLQQQPNIGVIVADQRMPEMTGVELLAQVYRLNPDTIRVIVTAYTDVADILDAINHGHIYQYITKPWDVVAMRLTLEHCVKTWQLHRKNKALLNQVQQKNKELSLANEQLQRLTTDLVEVQEEERKRIAMELHDEMGQTLSAMKMQVRLLEQSLDGGTGEEEERSACLLESLRTYCNLAIKSTRRLTRELSVTIVDDLGIDNALQDLIRCFARDSSLTDRSQLRKIEHLFSKHEQHQIYRIMQELLNNIGKHAEATSFTLDVVPQKDTILFQVMDDGCGFDSRKREEQANRKGHGFGLGIIGKRVAMLGGSWQINSRPGHGTRVSITVPFPSQNKKDDYAESSLSPA